MDRLTGLVQGLRTAWSVAFGALGQMASAANALFDAAVRDQALMTTLHDTALRQDFGELGHAPQGTGLAGPDPHGSGAIGTDLGTGMPGGLGGHGMGMGGPF